MVCEFSNADFCFHRTPLHADVYGSYSWSANVCGRKRWLLFPPGQEEFLKDDKKELRYFLTDSDLFNYNVAYFDIIQEPGEIIFVPSGWYHQVWNMWSFAYGEGTRNFEEVECDASFSSGWLHTFKLRHGITGKAVSGESGDVDCETVADCIQNQLPDLIKGYE
ncbi:JmjC domain-containing protein 4, partial [Araneus ventricosus]